MCRFAFLFIPLAHAWLHSREGDIFSDGTRVRLKCVNWYGAHEELFVSGGFDQQSCGFIADMISEIGANCVRIPLSVQMVRDNPSPPSWAIAGLNQSECRNTTALGVLDCQVDALTCRGMMVILNIHTSAAGWVGSWETTPQGLWHYPGYPTSDWIDSLVVLSERYRDNPMVVGIDIRNEIHDQDGVVITWGQSGDVDRDWKAATLMADAAIRRVNPDILVIVSGLSKSYDLRSMQDLHNYRSKFVFTTHVYPYSWWFTRVSWEPVIWVCIVILCLSVVGICTFGRSTYKIMDSQDSSVYLFVCSGSILVPLLGVLVSVGWIFVTTDLGCSSISGDVNWLLCISCVWLGFVMLTSMVLLSTENVLDWSSLLFWFCTWNIVICCVLIPLSFWFQTYAAVEWDLRRWKSDTIPVWVGEFGAGIGETTKQWQWLLRAIQGRHFAYWAINGRRWKNQTSSWDAEGFGLLTPDYASIRDVNWTRTIFKN